MNSHLRKQSHLAAFAKAQSQLSQATKPSLQDRYGATRNSAHEITRSNLPMSNKITNGKFDTGNSVVLNRKHSNSSLTNLRANSRHGSRSNLGNRMLGSTGGPSPANNPVLKMTKFA